MLFSGINRVQMAYGVYGYRRTNGTIHKGIDVDTPGGDVRIYATTAGRVEYAGMVPKGADRTWEWGWHVRVIDGAGKRHVYAHCEAGSLQVAAGQSVAAGQPLARMGNSGNAAANVPPYKHVHYQVDVRAGGAWQAVDPAPYVGIENRVGEWENGDDGMFLKIYARSDRVVSSQQLLEGVIGEMGEDGQLHGIYPKGDARMKREITTGPNGTLSKVLEEMRAEMLPGEQIVVAEK